MPTTIDFQDVIGQEHVKRALEVCAAGGHPILLSGSPGSGKTMLARALHGILPPLNESERESLEDRYADVGQSPPTTRPVVSPPATTSLRGLMGGSGQRGGPGVLALAQHGLLVLDDLPAFSAKLTPIAEYLDNTNGDASLSILLVATMQPCICGWHGDGERQCTCSPALISRYLRRIPQPFFDRIDIHVEVPRLGYEKLSSQRLGEPSSAVRERVIAARERQHQRFGEICMSTNAAMTPAQIREHCRLDGAGQSLMKAAVRQLSLSARGYHRVLKLARTIADLAGAEMIGAAHLAEAVQYRPRRVE